MRREGEESLRGREGRGREAGRDAAGGVLSKRQISERSAQVETCPRRDVRRAGISNIVMAAWYAPR